MFASCSLSLITLTPDYHNEAFWEKFENDTTVSKEAQECFNELSTNEMAKIQRWAANFVSFVSLSNDKKPQDYDQSRYELWTYETAKKLRIKLNNLSALLKRTKYSSEKIYVIQQTFKQFASEVLFCTSPDQPLTAGQIGVVIMKTIAQLANIALPIAQLVISGIQIKNHFYPSAEPQTLGTQLQEMLSIAQFISLCRSFGITNFKDATREYNRRSRAFFSEPNRRNRQQAPRNHRGIARP